MDERPHRCRIASVHSPLRANDRRSFGAKRHRTTKDSLLVHGGKPVGIVWNVANNLKADQNSRIQDVWKLILLSTSRTFQSWWAIRYTGRRWAKNLNGATHNRCDTMGYYALAQGRVSRKKSFSLWHSATARCQRECRAEIFGILAQNNSRLLNLRTNFNKWGIWWIAQHLLSWDLQPVWWTTCQRHSKAICFRPALHLKFMIH